MTYRSKIARLFATILFSVVAQNFARAADDNALHNMFHAVYRPLETHADCAGPTQIPFAVSFSAADLLVALSVDPKPIISEGQNEISSVFVEEPEICYQTIRKGTETVSVELPCPKRENKLALSQWSEDTSIEANLIGQASVCLSLKGFRVLDGEWKLNLSNSDQSFVIEDDFHADDVSLVFEQNPSFINRLYPDERPSDIRAGFRLMCRDLQFDADEAKGAHISIKVGMYLDEAPKEACDKENNMCFERFTVVTPSKYEEISLQNTNNCFWRPDLVESIELRPLQ